MKQHDHDPQEEDLWISEHEDLISHLAEQLGAFTPEMFIDPECKDEAMLEVAQACCHILNDHHEIHFPGKKRPSPKRLFGAASTAALESRSIWFFKSIAKGLERKEKDRNVLEAVIGAIEEHGRIPSNKEVMKHLTGVTEKTLQRRLREVGVSLPQAKRNGTAPRLNQ
jgi:hypothetical protein